MKDLGELSQYRDRFAELEVWGAPGEPGNGIFRFRKFQISFLVIASSGYGWEHVSISTRKRIPTWDEMCWCKAVFFHDTETVMQLHPPKQDHISYDRFTLHLWRPTESEIPRPPWWMVGPKQGGDNGEHRTPDTAA